MPTESCPVKGFEDFTITYPDEGEWIVRHRILFGKGVDKAIETFGDECDIQVRQFLGTLAVCKVENRPTMPIDKWPLPVYAWVLDTVYYGPGGYREAVSTPKNSLSSAPTTQREESPAPATSLPLPAS